jgi:hypothetical protein
MSRTYDIPLPEHFTEVKPLTLAHFAKTDMTIKRSSSTNCDYIVMNGRPDCPVAVSIKAKPVNIYEGAPWKKDAQLPNSQGYDLSVDLWVTGTYEPDAADADANTQYNNTGVSVTFHKVPFSYLGDTDTVDEIYSNLVAILLGMIAKENASSTEAQAFTVSDLLQGALNVADRFAGNE